MRRYFYAIGILLSFIIMFCNPAVEADEQVTIDFAEQISQGAPEVFGGTQPRGLSEDQWDILKKQGFTFMRSQADLTELVPADSPEEYLNNVDGCADPENWNWDEGVYGGDFAQEAIDRGMDVCYVIKNARWNRYEGAPDDEETMPRSLEVWGDIVTKIVNHYEGKLTYIELFNEVDRDPQFFVEGSDYTRKTGYQAVARTALEAVARSDYPESRVGGTAAAGFGEEQVRWLLEDDTIREGIGFISFHDFDNPDYPHEGVVSLKNLLEEYNVDVPIVRSSYVPEYGREGGLPGTLEPAPIAHHLIGALKDGLAASGLWEIQNKGGEDDPRYWFHNGETVKTANLWLLMSNTLKLGKGPSQVMKASGPFSLNLGALNHADQPVAVMIGDESKDVNVTLENLDLDGRVKISIYSTNEHSGGEKPVGTLDRQVENGAVSFPVSIQEGEVVGLLIEN
ncbi:MAG: hypothetical protein GF372_12235 [Candidatus Marinimicrobia bacterium]|nr:hypothetical protein [Candidatus Neomarinimicrobiota bacterium]